MNGKLFQTCPLISLLRRQLPPRGKPLAIPTNPNLPNSSSRTPADTRPAFNPEAFKTKPPLWSENFHSGGI